MKRKHAEKVQVHKFLAWKSNPGIIMSELMWSYPQRSQKNTAPADLLELKSKCNLKVFKSSSDKKEELMTPWSHGLRETVDKSNWLNTFDPLESLIIISLYSFPFIRPPPLHSLSLTLGMCLHSFVHWLLNLSLSLQFENPTTTWMPNVYFLSFFNPYYVYNILKELYCATQEY